MEGAGTSTKSSSADGNLTRHGLVAFEGDTSFFEATPELAQHDVLPTRYASGILIAFGRLDQSARSGELIKKQNKKKLSVMHAQATASARANNQTTQLRQDQQWWLVQTAQMQQ